MSYTMTIEEPEKAAWFEERYSQLSQEQLGALFVSILMQTKGEALDYIRQRDAILAVAGGRKADRTEENEFDKANKFRALCRELPPSGLPRGYVFSRDEVSERESRCLS